MEPSFNSVKALPYIGSAYFNLPADKRILVLGHSHYSNHWFEGITRESVASYLKERDNGKDISGEYRSFLNFETSVLGESASPEEAISFWNRVAFCNYVQEAMPEDNKTKKPSKQQYIDSYDAFFETLEVLRKTILSQVRKYRDFEKALVSKPYHDLFNEDIYWVTPLTLFSAGNYDDIWQTISGEERFWVWNGVIQGYGHSEFATDLDKGSWYKENEILGVGVHVFIRIEWNKENPVVWLCWEYYNQKTRKYIPTNKIKSLDIKRQAIESLLKFKEIWKRNESYSHLKIHTTSKKASSIKALKCDISGNQDISEVVKDIKNVMLYYSEEIKSIIDSFIVEDNKLTFNEEKYKV